MSTWDDLNMPCQEFLELMRQMRIGIDAKMAMELFQQFQSLNWEQWEMVGISVGSHMFCGVWSYRC